MNATAEIRMRRIHGRAQRYRARSEALRRSYLATGSLFLISGAVLLLRNGAGAYVVVGLLAFALGVLATVLCVRMKGSAAERMQIDDEERR